MPLMRMLIEPALIVHAQMALGTSQEELGKKLGVSRRTITRWMRRESYPSPLEWANLARLVYPRNRDLAVQIASGLKETLVTLGIEAPPPPPPPPPAPPPPPPLPPTRDVVDSIVCAAADAIDVTPRAVRPAVVAVFDRYASLGLSLAQVLAELRPVSPEGSTRRSTTSPGNPRPRGG